MMVTEEIINSLNVEKRRGGGSRLQTWRECAQCRTFFKLPKLKQFFCTYKCKTLFQSTIPSGKKGKKYPHLMRARVGNCEVCSKEYRAVNDYKERKQKYCSKQCADKVWRAKVTPSNFRTDEKNGSWKGDGVGYSGIHRWVERKLGAPRVCWHCGSKRKKKYEWCNIDHKYRRDLNDWLRLCTSCHRKNDAQFTKVNRWG